MSQVYPSLRTSHPGALDMVDLLVQPVVQYLKPANQLQLTSSELEEEIPRVLNATRPGPGRVRVRYNLEEKAFKAEPQLEQMTVHYATDGCLLLLESEEGRRVQKAQASEDAEKAKKVNQVSSARTGSPKLCCQCPAVSNDKIHLGVMHWFWAFSASQIETKVFPMMGNLFVVLLPECIWHYDTSNFPFLTVVLYTSLSRDIPPPPPPPPPHTHTHQIKYQNPLQAEGGDAAIQIDGSSPAKRLRNQFNFSERGAQTIWYPLKQRGTCTDLPEIEEASGSCSQWEIYDAYAADQKQQRQQVELLFSKQIYRRYQIHIDQTAV